jgi:hypothetical protein
MWFLDENMMLMMLVSSPSLLIQDLNIKFELFDTPSYDENHKHMNS